MSTDGHNSDRILKQRIDFFQRERPHTWSAAHLRVADALVSDLAGRLAEVEAERDAARRDLARIVQLCRDAAHHLEVTAIQPYGALADRLRVEAGVRLSSFRPAGLMCGVVVRERVSGNVITRTLCPLPPGHDGEHAEALAGD